MCVIFFYTHPDIDECSMKSSHSKCGVNSVCTNTIGKFRCSCKPGYEFPDEVLRICYGTHITQM